MCVLYTVIAASFANDAGTQAHVCACVCVCVYVCVIYSDSSEFRTTMLVLKLMEGRILDKVCAHLSLIHAHVCVYVDVRCVRI